MPSRRADHSSMHIFVLYGIGQDIATHAADACDGIDNIVAVETRVGLLPWLVTVMTSGIVAPRTARVYCKQKVSQEIGRT